jgi:hypothetical protein
MGEPDDVQRGLAELERYVAEQAPPVVPVADRVAPAPAGSAVGGVESRRVQRIRAEVAEAHTLLGLLADEAPFLVDSRRARRRRRAMAQAARLHALGQDPAALAWRAARWRRNLTVLAMTALLLALGWSSAGVQHFAANGAAAGSAAWWLAWLVEPLVSLALLCVVGARAFFASRGQPLKDATLTRVEVLFLSLTVTMNVWPYLPWVAGQGYTFSGLLVHTVGPVVAVAVVRALPRVWDAFTGLAVTAAHAGGYSGPTGPSYRQNTAVVDRATARLLARAVDLISRGALPAQPSATQLHKALGGGMDPARRVRDLLAGGA